MTVQPQEEDNNKPLLSYPDGTDYLVWVMKSIESHWNLHRIQAIHFSELHYDVWCKAIGKWKITRAELTRLAESFLFRQPFKDSFPTIEEILVILRPYRHQPPASPRPEPDPEAVIRKSQMIAEARERLAKSVKARLAEDRDED